MRYSLTMPARTNPFQRLVYLLKTHAAAGATVTESKMLVDLVTGVEREVDVWVEATVSGQQVRIAVECRDHGRLADVTWVEQMKCKHERLPTHALVLVSRRGFTPEAAKLALACNIETHSLDEFGDAEADKLLGRTGTLWKNFYELKPTKVLVHVLPPDGSAAVDVGSHPTTEVFSAAGESAGTVDKVVAGLLALPKTRQYMETTGEAQHKFFTLRWVLPTDPPAFLRKVEPARLERIESMYIEGTAKFEPVEFRVSQARIGAMSFLWGTGTVFGAPAVALVTPASPGQALVSTSIIHKSKSNTRAKQRQKSQAAKKARKANRPRK
jgi:hypothetical protein